MNFIPFRVYSDPKVGGSEDEKPRSPFESLAGHKG